MLSENSLVTARKCVEKLYDGVCDIIGFADITDPVTHITSKKEITAAEKIPCRISYEKNSAAVQTDSAADIFQRVRLFVAPELRIPAGSKITVTQNGVTFEYACSGASAVYPTHQEIILELFREKA